MGAPLTGHLRAIQADHPCLGDVRGPGLMIGVEIVDEHRPPSRTGARPADGELAVRFLEKRDRFVWHGNMLLDGSRMQTSFLKELVSLRAPTSRYSFLNYLHRQGRLQDFINLRTFYPSRHEFNDDLSWVASDFGGLCDYGMEAVAVEPVRVGDAVPHVRIRIRARDADGRERSLLARNVVIGAGATLLVPDVFDGLVRKGAGKASSGPPVIHSNDYLAAADDLARAGRVAVVVLGQSAAGGLLLDFADLYLQGCCEATHGLSDTLLSILPIRAQEIAVALTGGTGRGRGQQIRELTSAQ